MEMVLTYVHECGTIGVLTHGIETSKSNEVFVYYRNLAGQIGQLAGALSNAIVHNIN